MKGKRKGRRKEDKGQMEIKRRDTKRTNNEEMEEWMKEREGNKTERKENTNENEGGRRRENI